MQGCAAREHNEETPRACSARSWLKHSLCNSVYMRLLLANRYEDGQAGNKRQSILSSSCTGVEGRGAAIQRATEAQQTC